MGEPCCYPVGDVGDHPLRFRNARWRTWLRVHTPDVLYYRLGLVVPNARDCGRHEWNNQGHGIDACYHCEITRTTPPDAPWFDSEDAGLDIKNVTRTGAT